MVIEGIKQASIKCLGVGLEHMNRGERERNEEEDEERNREG